MKIVNLEIAQLLKEKGFNTTNNHSPRGNMCYQLPENKLINASYGNVVLGYILAPDLYQVKDWLRMEYNIHVEVKAHGPHSDYTGSVRYSCNIVYRNELSAIVSVTPIPDELFALQSYEEALEKGIIYCLEKLITNA